jgi:predicted O-methyltransferase YrrM
MNDPRVAAIKVLDRLYAEDAAQRAANLPSSRRTRNVDRETGRWLSLLARATAARAILEIGSSNGVSTIWLAEAARATGGAVTGTEIIPERAAAANANLREAGLADRATVLAGDARQTVAGLAGPFDLVFIDAEKDDYVGHFLALIDKVRPGGLILADNVVSHDLAAYQQMLCERADVATVTVPIGRGIEFTVRTGDELGDELTDRPRVSP